MADIFVSYARSNARDAASIAEALSALGYSVWFDAHLPAHRSYAEVIEEQLTAASAVLVLWSKDSVRSQWVRSEANRARETGRLVQVRLDDARLPMPFDEIQCAELGTAAGKMQNSAGWRAIVGSIGALAAGPTRTLSKSTQISASWPSASRRGLITGGAAAFAAAAGGGLWLFKRRSSEPSMPPDAAALLEQAKGALWQNTPEGQNQAIGISRQVTSSNPTLVEAWGRLAMSYAMTSHWRASAEAALLQQRARSAGQQALALNVHDAHALVAIAFAKPFMGNWLNIIGEIGKALSYQPKDGETNFMLAMVLSMTGQNREALTHVHPILRTGPTPGICVWNAQMLWSTGRYDALDALLDQATKLYPTHFGVWFTRFYTQMMGGRPEAALALAADTDALPTGIDPAEISAVVRVAKAIQSHSGAEADAVVNEWKERARHGAGYAENAAQFMSALGRTDDAFAMLRAYYFSEGFDPGEVRFERATGSFTAHNDRQTAFLFNPAMASVRKDARFARLMGELRLTDYWRTSGHGPDYLV